MFSQALMYCILHTRTEYKYTLYTFSYTQLEQVRVCIVRVRSTLDLLGTLIGNFWFKIHKIWHDLENAMCPLRRLSSNNNAGAHRDARLDFAEGLRCSFD